MALRGALRTGLNPAKNGRRTSVAVHASQKVDVAILGGGPAGLLAAKSVSRACPGAVVQVGILQSLAHAFERACRVSYECLIPNSGRIRLATSSTFQVYESVSEYKPQGAGVAIHPNGWRALEAIDPALEKM